MTPDRTEERTIARDQCPHLDQLDETVTSPQDRCVVCGEVEHKRICMTCGTVTCCESRKGHDADHYDETGHPFIRPHRESYDFLWCYECEAYLTG